MKFVLVICLLLVAIALNGCSELDVLPVGDDSDQVATEDQPVLTEPKSESALLEPEEIAQVVLIVMPNCERLLIANLQTREILIGYGHSDAYPIAMASLTLIGSDSGSIVLAVGVHEQAARTRITRAMTLKPRDTLYGLDAYLSGESQFLEQFSGMDVGENFQNVDAVTGATRICEALRDNIDTETQELESYYYNPVRMENLVASSLPIEGFNSSVAEVPMEDAATQQN